MRNGRRMVFVGPGRPLECHEAEVGSPVPGGLVVRTTIAGVCGTDAHRLDGDLPDPGRPVTFGHEGIGVVEELGAGVTADLAGVPMRVGDTVYWSPSSREPGIPSELGWPPPAELPNPAAYQDYATLPPSNMVYRVPDGADPEAVIAFGCAMPTALGGMARLGGVRPGQSVVVQGCGPVGLAATLLAGLTAARQVIVIGAPDKRLVAAAPARRIDDDSARADDRRGASRDDSRSHRRSRCRCRHRGRGAYGRVRRRDEFARRQRPLRRVGYLFRQRTWWPSILSGSTTGACRSSAAWEGRSCRTTGRRSTSHNATACASASLS